MNNAKDEDEPLECDAEDEGPNFRGIGLQIGDDLHDDDIEALKFISRDFLPGAKLERMKTVEELFLSWEKYKRFGKDNPWFLAECLVKIQRFDLLDELGIDESVFEERLQQGEAQISSYRKMLLEVAEDLDSEELYKMLYLLGDLKKKDRGKIQSVMSLLTYLEQTKQITQSNVTKLKAMLRTIDRNDLVDVVITYEASKGIDDTVQTTKEEHMDISETNVEVTLPPSKPQPGKTVHRTIAENPPPLVQDRPLGVGVESSSSGLRAEAPAPPLLNTTGQKVTQNVIVAQLLLEMSHQLGRDLDDTTWLVFASKLNVKLEILLNISRNFLQMTERVYELLTVWLHTWHGGHDDAMAAIIKALHEVQIHHLAEQFGRMYAPQGTTELQDVSLSSRSITSRSSDHENISVNKGEAQYREPSIVSPPAVGEAEAIARPVVDVPDNIMPFYKMDHRPRGICVIINNAIFHKDEGDVGARDMPDREGTNVDAGNLLKTFTELDFEVRQFDNLKSSEMVRVLVNIALNIDHSHYDCLVCCILSHGTQGYIYGTDGRLVNITDLTGPFKSIVCPSLAGKPKLFFIQACQGREKQPGQEVERDGAAVELDTDGVPREVIPNEADFLIGYATVPGFVSYRSRTHGSWYVTKLCEMLDKHGRKYDVLSVLLLVNNEVGRANAMMGGGRFKQSPAPLYTLRKKLMFS